MNLTDLKARGVKPGGKPIADGTVSGLRLHAGDKKGNGKWLMRFTSPETRKRRDMGFGTYPDVSITEARKSAAAARELIRNGIDPIDARKADKQARTSDAQALTFEKAARQFHADHKPGWNNSKHAAQWITTLETYVFPHIGNRKVDDLKARDFADALRNIWLEKPETASRVKQRCSSVMDWCAAQELIGANPVGVVVKLLPKQPKIRDRVVHHPAMPWQDVPVFVEGVLRAGNPSLSKSMLEFLILTAARSGEVRAMTWDEVDLVDCVWTVPAERMKANAAHRVPLSGRAIAILQEQKDKAEHPDIVFPSPSGSVPSDMILTKFLRDQKAASSEKGRIATAHGFRSSFRDWASENGYPRDYAERALAHTISNQTEAAYHRTDLLDQRRGMMESWAQYVCGMGDQGDNIVSISAS
ncbi:MAG: integrase [Rhodospirillaceae bacterium]|nr:integrase [Rhodospirillaceae bacterium]